MSDLNAEDLDLQGRVAAKHTLTALRVGVRHELWERREAGRDQLPSGTYSIRAEIDSERETVRWVVIR
jgi:hypothetical protein